MKTQRIILVSFLLLLLAGTETSAQQADNPKVLLEVLQNKEEAKSRMYKEFQENGNKFKDAKAFFLNEMGIVNTADKFLSVAKGKKKLEIDVIRVGNIVESTVFNLYVGGAQLVSSEPAVSVQLLEEYFRALASPQFSGLRLTASKDAYFIYAMALEYTGGDQTKIEAALQEALTSGYGAEACLRLQMIYLQRGDNDSAVRVADTVINSGTMKDAENAVRIFNFKAAALFNSGHYDKAYQAYAEADAKYPGNIEFMTGAGTSAMKQAIMKKSDPSTTRQWYQKALTYLKKAEKEFPDQSYLWGYPIWQCYNQLSDSVMAAKYKKYCE